MKGLITREFAERHVVAPLSGAFNIQLVGSLATKGSSYNDIDLAMFYENSNSDEMPRFIEALKSLGWEKNENQENYDKNSKGDVWTMKVKDSNYNIFDICLEVYFQQNLSQRSVND